MNRIELVALFTALKNRAENNDIEAIKEIVYAVLDEAQYVKTSRQKPEHINED